MNSLTSGIVKTLLISTICMSSTMFCAGWWDDGQKTGTPILNTTLKDCVPVILVDKVELESQIKEMRQLRATEIAIPVATGLVSGLAYNLAGHNLVNGWGSRWDADRLRAIGELAATATLVKMSKKILFGLLHEKEKKRNTIDSLDTMATIFTYFLARAF